MAEKLPTRKENYSGWYNELVVRADLAQHSATKGSMVIKPYGFSIWETMQRELDDKFKATGHVNAYFPLLIPKSFLSREADHIDGFAMECAVVTHHRLQKNPEGDGVIVDPSAKLEEEYVIRPTSETIIWNTFRDWIQSYRDLPLLVNQRANIVRWEMRTRLFLRTTEFLWQEGHTAHETKEEALDETLKILDIYADFSEKFLCVPVIKGIKPEHEKFPGAVDTYCIEALMQDGKGLQAGTSHFLGQKFAKAFDVTYLSRENKPEYVWASSWGVTTRLVGALIMAHSDDDGLILPPTVAPHQVVIVPLGNKPADRERVLTAADKIRQLLKEKGIRVKLDDDTNRRPGWKFAQYELQGVPVRVVIGPRDLDKGMLEIARRDTKEKSSIEIEGAENHVAKLLEEIQQNILQKALDFRAANTHQADNWEDFKSLIADTGVAVYAHW